MRKENNVCKELKNWFNNYGIQCWLNEGENRFIIKGERKKPDLLIYSNKLNQYIIIEVKNGDVAKEIFDASKILEYYKNYYNNKTKYFINVAYHKEEIKISSFAVATLYSMFGKLFKCDEEPLSMEDIKNDNWKFVNKERNLEPYWEYKKSHDYLRHIWANWRIFRERKYMPGLGIILSNILNHKEISFDVDAPILFDMQWEEIGKARWKVRQKWL